MSTQDPTPTPETDAEVRHWNCARIDFARRLERERDAARADAAMWKANHDNQVKIKSVLIQRPDLKDRAERISKLIEERDALARWKAEALSVTPPLQEIGVALGLTLGDSIHDKILPGIQALQAELAAYKDLLVDPYVFFAMQHKACRPWKKSTDAWLDRVEALTEWEPFEQIEQYRATKTAQG